MRILPMELGNKVSRIVAWKFWTALLEILRIYWKTSGFIPTS
jgi:hypothetical protein